MYAIRLSGCLGVEVLQPRRPKHYARSVDGTKSGRYINSKKSLFITLLAHINISTGTVTS